MSAAIKPKNYLFKIIETVFFILVPIILLILPADYFDNGQTICLSVLIFGIRCLGCGMTRACMHMIHLEFGKAYSFNPLSFVVLPVFSYLLLARLYANFRLFYKVFELKKSE
jgi:hypothetical protein